MWVPVRALGGRSPRVRQASDQRAQRRRGSRRRGENATAPGGSRTRWNSVNTRVLTQEPATRRAARAGGRLGGGGPVAIGEGKRSSTCGQAGSAAGRSVAAHGLGLALEAACCSRSMHDACRSAPCGGGAGRRPRTPCRWLLRLGSLCPARLRALRAGPSRRTTSLRTPWRQPWHTTRPLRLAGSRSPGTVTKAPQSRFSGSVAARLFDPGKYPRASSSSASAAPQLGCTNDSASRGDGGRSLRSWGCRPCCWSSGRRRRGLVRRAMAIEPRWSCNVQPPFCSSAPASLSAALDWPQRHAPHSCIHG